MSGFHRIFRLSAVFLPSVSLLTPRPPSNTVSRARVYASPSPTHSVARPLPCSARDHGPLSRPVIKQPRGRQIESVEETRERGRRGDGQPAATMVSIVKGAIVARPPRSYLCNRSNRKGGKGAAGGSLGRGGRRRRRIAVNSP